LELTTVSYIDLGIQIAIFIVLIAGSFLAQKQNKKTHALLMTSALLINTVLILVIMVQPFLEESSEIFENLLVTENMLFLSHHVLGLIAEVLGIILVLKWAMNRFESLSCKGKLLMRLTSGTWIISILLGLVIFILHFIE